MFSSFSGGILLSMPLFLFAGCAPQPPVTRTEPTPSAERLQPLSPAELVWSHRPAGGNRLLVGLTHLPDRPLLTVKPERQAKLIDLRSGVMLARVRPGAPVMLTPGANATVRFATPGSAGKAPALRLEPAVGGLRIEGRRHWGSLLCWTAQDRVACALDLPLEAYLEGVVPGEVPAAWPLEAQKALAVAARTYALASRGKHAAEGFDLCDGTHCQMYLGRVPGATRSEQAVRATRSLVALYEGRLIRAFYSADCGGRTANNEDVPFPDNPAEPQPYLRSVPDVPWIGGPHYCARSPHHRWRRLLTAAQIEAALNTEPETAIGSLREILVSEVDVSGRARRVEIDGSLPDATGPGSTHSGREPASSAPAQPAPRQPFSPSVQPNGPLRPSGANPAPVAPGVVPVTRSLAGYAFRSAIGPRRLKSTRFTIEPVADGSYRFEGSGYGHGVGLCQIGAKGMASPPYRRTFRQILAHYYRGVQVAPVPEHLRPH